MDYDAVLGELEALVRETYQLWDQEWVGFSWRSYTPRHVERVRGLARSLGSREGADPTVLEFASLLHDVTKPFDGEIIVKDGKRVLDGNGFWKNELLLPDRDNRITTLYSRLELAGTLHNVSGAVIASHLLREYGFGDGFRTAVADTIVAHLKPDGGIEGRVLYDADTIDANIGLPAFYRNIHIVLHNQEKQFAQRDESLDSYLRTNLSEFLGPYLRERLPTWNEGKNRDFVPKLTTVSGAEIARVRIERLRGILEATGDELEKYDEMVDSGRLAVIRYFFGNRSNPDLAEQLCYLQTEWLPGAPRTAGAGELLAWLQTESEGTA